MREKPNSYLNQRIITAEAQETSGVQTEILTQATVKITSDIAAFANPYSILTNEFSSAKFRAVEVSFVIDPTELAKNVVKLPTVSAEAKSETAKKPKEEKQRVKEKEYTIPEEFKADTAPKAPQMGDMEILNRLAEFQGAAAQKTQNREEIFEVPKDVEVLNELQSEETTNKKSKTTKEEINTAMNGLEGLLAELSDGEESHNLGMG